MAGEGHGARSGLVPVAVLEVSSWAQSPIAESHGLFAPHPYRTTDKCRGYIANARVAQGLMGYESGNVALPDIGVAVTVPKAIECTVAVMAEDEAGSTLSS
jgi:hypothetical protein